MMVVKLVSHQQQGNLIRWLDNWKEKRKRRIKQRDIYRRRIKSNWDIVESLNSGYINQNNAYVGKHGYLRWKDTNRLCHRDIAFNQIFKSTFVLQIYNKTLISQIRSSILETIELSK